MVKIVYNYQNLLYNTGMKIESLLKINSPSGKLEFFKYSIVIGLIQTVCALMFVFLTSDVLGLKSIFWMLFIFVIVIELPLLYLYFIQCARRLWDITGSKNTGLIINTALFVISVIGMISFPLVTIIIFLVLILCQGKIVKNV